MFNLRQLKCGILMGIIVPLVVGTASQVARAQAPAKFPAPGTYVTHEGENNEFEWTTTINDDGTFNASVRYKTRSGSGNGQWKVAGGRVYLRWQKVPDFLEKAPGAPQWIEVTDQFRGKSPIERRRGTFGYDENAVKSLDSTATLLAKDAKYKAVGKKTKCSEFVRDFGKKLGADLPELQGNSAQQFDNLWKASKKLNSRWVALDFQWEDGKIFEGAQKAADSGKFVVVAWKNPNPTETDSGHVAVVVPRRRNEEMPYSGSLESRVPLIAQAGASITWKGTTDSVWSRLPLNYGFGPLKLDETRVFVLERP